MKRGLLDTCVLSVLSREDSYGYKIIRDISGCIEISESTLYPILRRLEAAGCLTDYSVPHNGRLRKFYRITAEERRRSKPFWKTGGRCRPSTNLSERGGTMTKAEFLTALERRLLQLPEAERRRQLDYFAEMIDDRIEEGTEETEAVAGLATRRPWRTASCRRPRCRFSSPPA